MWDIRRQILTAAAQQGIAVVELTEDQREGLLSSIRTRFTTRMQIGSMWEGMRDAYGVQDADSWQWVGEFVADRTSILLFEEFQCAFQVSSGTDLVYLIGQTFNVEFYVTDLSVSFVLCYNHHDCLLAVGDAAEWLRGRNTGL
jgi:hypothetical protein